jgi:hypothetical protein
MTWPIPASQSWCHRAFYCFSPIIGKWIDIKQCHQAIRMMLQCYSTVSSLCIQVPQKDLWIVALLPFLISSDKMVVQHQQWYLILIWIFKANANSECCKWHQNVLTFDVIIMCFLMKCWDFGDYTTLPRKAAIPCTLFFHTQCFLNVATTSPTQTDHDQFKWNPCSVMQY